jgi:ligand-binding sensor domain-containing protein
MKVRVFYRAMTFCCCVLLHSTVWAQSESYTPHLFTRLTQQNGLLDETNSFVFRDSRGFVWISSMTGLNRYDGNHIKTYKSTNQATSVREMFGSPIQSSFFEDKNGDIWFCTYQAINVYRRKKDQFEHFCLKIDAQEIQNEYYVFHLDTKGQLWTRIENNLYLFSTKTAKFQLLHPFSCLRATVELQNEEVQAVLSYDWSAKEGFTRYAYAHEATPQYQSPKVEQFLKNQSVHGIVTEKNKIWLATSSGLVKFDKNTRTSTFFTDFEGKKIVDLHCLEQLNDRQLAIGTSRNGYFIFDKTNLRFVEQVFPRPFSSESSTGFVEIRDMYVDNDRNLWLSDWDYGVAFTNLENLPFQTIPLVTPPQKFHSSLIFPLQDGHFWVVGSAANEGILELDAQQKVIRQLLPTAQIGGLPAGKITSVTEDFQQNLWLIVNAKLWNYNRASRIFSPINTPKLVALRNQLVALPDETLLFVTDEHKIGSLKAEKNGNRWTNTGGGLPAPFDTLSCNGVMKSANNFLHFLGKDKLYIFECTPKPHLVKQIDLPITASNLTISPNSAWVWWLDNNALQGFRVGDWQVKTFGTAQDFPQDFIKSLVMCDEENIWLSGENRLYHYNISQKVARSFLTDLNKFSMASVAQMANGALIFGGVKGITIVNPSQDINNHSQPIVHLLDIKVNDQNFFFDENVSETQQFTFSHTQRTLVFEMGISYLQRTQSPHLQYMLENYDNNWIDANAMDATARYAQLPAGNYRLRIRAFFPTQQRQLSPEKVVEITVLPPWWKTWWFILLSFFTTLGLVAWLIRARIASIRHEANIRQRMSDIELRSLQSQMNPHFIFNVINSVNYLILYKKNPEAVNYLTNFAGLMRNLLDASAVPSIRLEKEIEILRGYLEAEQLRFDFDFEIEIAEDVDEFETELPSMLIQPFVENAVIHGISRRQYVAPMRGLVKVSFAYDVNLLHKNLKCTVEDNGNGWENLPPSIQTVKTVEHLRGAQKGKKHQSRGIEITRERLELLKYLQKSKEKQHFLNRFGITFYKKSKNVARNPIQVVNLRDIDASRTGTRVVIEIPQAD